jgi:hypothetical protein
VGDLSQGTWIVASPLRILTVGFFLARGEVRVSKPMRAPASTLSQPERIIIDLADVGLLRPRRIAVNAADVQAVDVSPYLVNPVVTRVVVYLARPHPYHVQASGNSLTVRIETAAQPARQESDTRVFQPPDDRISRSPDGCHTCQSTLLDRHQLGGFLRDVLGADLELLDQLPGIS